MLLVTGRRFVVRARGQPITRLLCLYFFGEGRLDDVERLRGLLPHLLPLREVLLERFSPGRGQARAGRRFEREATAAAAREARVVAAHLVHEVPGLLKLALVLLAQPLQLRPVSSSACLPGSGSSRLSRRFLGAGPLRFTLPAAAVLSCLSRCPSCLSRLSCPSCLSCPSRLSCLPRLRHPVELAAGVVQLVPKLLRSRTLIGQLLRLAVLRS